MTAVTHDEWTELNQRHLSAAVAEVRAMLERQLASAADAEVDSRPTDVADATSTTSTTTTAASTTDTEPPGALDVVCTGFGLSAFERLVLILCAGVELDSSFADLVSKVSAGRQGHPTFGLALAALPGAHWSALSPGRPLRRWCLVELHGSSPVTGELRIDERVLHVLAGVGDADQVLGGLVHAEPVPEHLVDSQVQVAAQLVDTWRAAPEVVPQLLGRGTAAKRAVAADAAAQLGARLAVLDARGLPSDPQDLARLATLTDREAVLAGRILCIDADDIEQTASTGLFLDRAEGLVVLCARDPIDLHARPALGLDVKRATATEQASLWRELRGEDQETTAVSEQFDLDPQVIQTLARTARPGELWARCRASTRPRLGPLAQRVDTGAGWAQIVLPAAQLDALHRIANQVRHRKTVFEAWGMRGASARGTGTTALFAGPSGTGKTLAAEVVAGELGLDLYRIDLSAVVSKYIGETEKNLRRVFDAADEASAVLLFDEADALFGRRTEVKDSHDRFANIEISYLLQRMEQYHGLAILTTNMQEALDPAFQRRIRFVITFPFPDADRREQIWNGVFGPEAPLADFDPRRLARIGLTGGSIRNIAINAAFLAAANGRRVTMDHLFQAARDECVKLDQPWPGTPS
ncbi:MAG TPA: ATP-binding protein [Nocardioidaceae bacterium]